MSNYPKGMICRKWITKDGIKIFAKDYGKKAFCFVPSKKKIPTVIPVGNS